MDEELGKFRNLPYTDLLNVFWNLEVLHESRRQE